MKLIGINEAWNEKIICEIYVYVFMIDQKCSEMYAFGHGISTDEKKKTLSVIYP